MNQKKSVVQILSLILVLGSSACNDSVKKNNPFNGIVGGGGNGGDDGGWEIPTSDSCVFYRDGDFGEYIERADIGCVKMGLEKHKDPKANYIGFFEKKPTPSLFLALQSHSLGSNFNKDMTIIPRMLLDAGADINQVFERETPMTAVMNLGFNYMPIMMFLASHPKMDVNAPGSAYPFEKALYIKNSDLALKLLDRGVDFNKTMNRSDLMNEALANNMDLVAQKMIAKGASLERNGDRGLQFFLSSIQWGKKWLFDHLLAKGVPVNGISEDGESPLTVSMEQNDRVYFDTVLSKLKLEDLNYRDSKGKSAVDLAISSGRYERAVQLIDRGVDVGSLSPSRQNLIHVITKNGGSGSLELLNKLISKNVSINDLDNQGMSPVAYAVQSKDLQMVKLLQQKGANMNFVFTNKNTLLHLAAEKNAFEMVKYLSEFVAVDTRGANGKTALMMTTSMDVGVFLLSKGANIDAVDQDGHHLISHLVWNRVLIDDENYMNYLIDQKLNLNADLWDDVNPLKNMLAANCSLHSPIEEKPYALIKKMIDAGVSLHAPSKFSEPPVFYAVDVRVLRYLVKADPKVKDDRNSNYLTFKQQLEADKKLNQDRMNRPSNTPSEREGYKKLIKSYEELIDVLK